MNVGRTVGMLMMAALLVPLPGRASSVEDEKPGPADKAPKTAQEHFDLAKAYEARTAEYQAEAEMHRKMLADYTSRFGSPSLRSKTGRDPWVDKMRAHCQGYITNAEALAKEASAFAQYHRMRGKEMEGQ
jgi:hypothetical protein